MSEEARMARVCDCGHVAQVHHGADHGPAGHQGCQHGSRLRGYCGCGLTSGQVADLPDPALFAADYDEIIYCCDPAHPRDPRTKGPTP